MIFFKKTIVFIITLSASTLLTFQAITSLYRKVSYLRNYLPYLIHTNIEDRKLLSYGNCNNFGYGYLKKIIDKLPNANIFPDTRYKDYQKFVFLFFPGYRNHIDNRLKVGIDLSDEDLKESLITEGLLVKRELINNKDISRWSFKTIDNYDQLTGFKLYFDKKSTSVNQEIKINLYANIYEKSPSYRWFFTVTSINSEFTYRLSNPVANFSYDRGGTDFVLEIENAPLDDLTVNEISLIEILGRKVDLSGYLIINKEQRCFTAVKKSFIDQIDKKGPESWRQYFKEITNVRNN